MSIAFQPPAEPAAFRPPEPEQAPAADPVAERTGETERSPIHEVEVPDSPAAVSLDERPGPLPEFSPDGPTAAEPAEDEAPADEVPA